MLLLHEQKRAQNVIIIEFSPLRKGAYSLGGIQAVAPFFIREGDSSLNHPPINEVYFRFLISNPPIPNSRSVVGSGTETTRKPKLRSPVSGPMAYRVLDDLR